MSTLLDYYHGIGDATKNIADEINESKRVVAEASGAKKPKPWALPQDKQMKQKAAAAMELLEKEKDAAEDPEAEPAAGPEEDDVAAAE